MSSKVKARKTDHPILFNTEMVKAILDGRKTQTRRVVTPLNSYVVGGEKKDWALIDFGSAEKNKVSPSLELPYSVWHQESLRVLWFGKDVLIHPKWIVGDRLWAREMFYTESGDIYYKADWPNDKPVNMVYDNGKWKPSIHMPRWASRINLEITGIRVERVQDITEEDCYKEGLDLSIGMMLVEPHWMIKDILRRKFKDLWDSINAKRGYGWDVNLWVWVIEFGSVGVKLK